MKILHVTKKYPSALGGDAVVVYNLEKQQKASGHKVVILTSNCSEIKNRRNIYKFGLNDTPAALDHITPKRLMSLIMLFFDAFKILKTEQPDLIHTHSIDMAFFLSFAARRYGIPIIHTFHTVNFNDPHQNAIRRKSELFFLRGARPQKIILLDPGEIKNFVKAGFPNTVFVPNGVNVDEWQTKDSKKNKNFTFIAVGRLEVQKGFTYLVEAAARLHRERMDFQVQIVGDGTLYGSLHQQIEKLGLTNHVFLLGQRSQKQLKELFSNANAFVMTSLWEGMPLTLLEAWAAGLPTIATNVNSVPFIAAGLSELTSPKDTNAVKRAMSKFIDRPSEAKALCTKSYSAVLEKYSWYVVAKQIDQVYEHL